MLTDSVLGFNLVEQSQPAQDTQTSEPLVEKNNEAQIEIAVPDLTSSSDNIGSPITSRTARGCTCLHPMVILLIVYMLAEATILIGFITQKVIEANEASESSSTYEF